MALRNGLPATGGRGTGESTCCKRREKMQQQSKKMGDLGMRVLVHKAAMAAAHRPSAALPLPQEGAGGPQRCRAAGWPGEGEDRYKGGPKGEEQQGVWGTCVSQITWWQGGTGAAACMWSNECAIIEVAVRMGWKRRKGKEGKGKTLTGWGQARTTLGNRGCAGHMQTGIEETAPPVSSIGGASVSCSDRDNGGDWCAWAPWVVGCHEKPSPQG